MERQSTTADPINRRERRALAAVGATGEDAGEVLKAIRVQLPAGLSPALDTKQAAIYTGLAAATLETLRCRGGGPEFVRYSRKAVRYTVAALDAWMAARQVASTSEAGAA